MLYTSTDPEGAPIAVSGVVVAPDGGPPEGGWPVVAWAHGTTGVDRRCAPSIDYPESGLVRVPELDELVAAGTVVAITDYPGLGTPGPHPYLVGESEGRAVLDSIRAARALLGTDAVSSTAAIYGHSQGGHASVWADQIAGSYAPSWTSPASRRWRRRPISARCSTTTSRRPMASCWRPGDLLVVGVLPGRRRGGDRRARRTAGRRRHRWEVHRHGCAGLHGRPRRARARGHVPLAESGDGTRLVRPPARELPGRCLDTIPLLVAQGESDTLVRPDVTSAYVQAQCAAGASIEYVTYPHTGHFAVRTVAAPMVRDWLLARLHGDPTEPGCTERQGSDE